MEGRGQNPSRSDARARGPVRGFPAAGRRRAGARLLGLVGLGRAPMDTAWAHAGEIAAAVCDGRTSAVAVVRAALARIAKHNRVLNAFTAVTEERALAKAAALDAERAKGRRLVGSLAGVPFAVKNLFDIAGLPTLAGSKINHDRAPAKRDATRIPRLQSTAPGPGGCSWARSTWANTPTTSPARTCTTAPRAIRTTWAG